MNTRRLVLHLIVGLLTFLLGLTAAVALGGFDPLARWTRHGYSQQYAIPPQSLSDTGRSYESYGGCRKARARTAELRYRVETFDAPLAPPTVAPAVPVLPPAGFDEDDAPPPPPRAPRPRH